MPSAVPSNIEQHVEVEDEPVGGTSGIINMRHQGLELDEATEMNLMS